MPTDVLGDLKSLRLHGMGLLPPRPSSCTLGGRSASVQRTHVDT